MADAFSTSRHFAGASGLDVLFDFVQDLIELATPDVALHLLIPFVIFPIRHRTDSLWRAVQPRRQLGALFERKLFDGSLDFSKAHVGDLTIAQLLFQVPVIQSERVSIGSSDPISHLLATDSADFTSERIAIALPKSRRLIIHRQVSRGATQMKH